MFGSPSRTGLFWALDGLAWGPETQPRAAMVLGCLAQIEINDNWVNKPESSLGAIFRSWMPQTAASNDERLATWTQTVRQSCAELSRIEIADIVIGEMLASAKIGKDGAWPCKAVNSEKFKAL